MYTNMQIWKHACIHTNKHTCIHTYVETCLHICIHTYIYTCIRTNMHVYLHTCMHMYMHACAYVYRDSNHNYICSWVCFLSAAIYVRRSYIFYTRLYILCVSMYLCKSILFVHGYMLCARLYIIYSVRSYVTNILKTPLYSWRHTYPKEVCSQ